MASNHSAFAATSQGIRNQRATYAYARALSPAFGKDVPRTRTRPSCLSRGLIPHKKTPSLSLSFSGLCLPGPSKGVPNVGNAGKGRSEGSGGRCAVVYCGLTPPPCDAALAAAARQMIDDFVRSSMVVGVGAGSGSLVAIHHLSSKIQSGSLKDILLVPASAMLASDIANYGIPMTTLDELTLQQRQLDVAFCDADLLQEGTLYGIIGSKEVPGRNSLNKEKMIAKAAKQFVVLVSSQNFVDTLEGTVPVEIQQFDWLDIAEEVDDIFIGDAEVWRRPSSGEAGPMGGDFPLVTEGGHFVLDLRFNVPLTKPEEVAKELESVPGVVSHGILLDEAHAAAVAYPDGVKIRTSLFRTSFTSS